MIWTILALVLFFGMILWTAMHCPKGGVHKWHYYGLFASRKVCKKCGDAR